jgi:hypothetical protein
MTSKWTICCLSPKELTLVYNIPTSLMGAFPNTFSSAALPFLGSAPGRLLSEVLKELVSKDKVTNNLLTSADSDVDRHTQDDIKLPMGSLAFEGSLHQGQAGMSFLTAMKADDAGNPTFIWDARVWGLEFHIRAKLDSFLREFVGQCPLETIRGFFLRWWRKLVWQCLWKHTRATYGMGWAAEPNSQHEQMRVLDSIRRASGADWWEWWEGSTLLHWRWPIYARRLAIEGLPPCFISKPPMYRVPQPSERNECNRVKMKAKLQEPLQRRYIERGPIQSLTGYFAVPKGDSNIQMVYDASKSGLNAALWVPSFGLPDAVPLTDLLTTESWMSDINLGENFLKFPLHADLQPFCGIDLRPVFQPDAPKGSKTLWMRWTRCMMGLKVGSHENFFQISWYKILYQAKGVSTGKISPPLHGNIASFGLFGRYVCEMACPSFFFEVLHLGEPYALGVGPVLGPSTSHEELVTLLIRKI